MSAPVWQHEVLRYAKRPSVLGLRLARPALNNPAQVFEQLVFVHASTFERREFMAREWRVLRTLLQHARRHS